MQKFHLKGLDAYRAIAALLVLVGHVELFKGRFGFNNFLELGFFKHTGGHIGVVLFFALSGFLITMLLLREKDKHATISLKDFYLRRIFRVWPLYYFIIFLSWLALAYAPSPLTIILCLTIFPNIAHAMGNGWSASPQIWSVGVEEQFYLGWPLLVKYTKHLLPVLIGVFFFFTFLPHGLLFILNRVYPDQEIMALVNKIFFGTKFNCMAAGGILAVLYHQRNPVVRLLNYNLAIAYSLILLPFALWLYGFHLPFFTEEIYSILFAISILNISTNSQVINLDFKPLTFLGGISYGIYMYHWLVLELLFRSNVLQFGGLGNSWVFNVFVYGMVSAATIFVAYLSYRFIESPLLRIKERYNR